MLENSKTIFTRAKQVLPGGVNSPVRAFNGVGGHPPFIKSGRGAYIIDIDDNRYLDFVTSWGALILGHVNPDVTAQVIQALHNGSSFGTPTEIEVEIAELIQKNLPAIEMLRMTSSGTEATLGAIRLARGFTGRDKIVKFAGCYHGHSDSLLVKSGSGSLTLGVPDSKGVPKSLADNTIVVPYNDLTSCEEIFTKYGETIAAVIVEPIAANNNLILPVPGFLSLLRNLCDKYDSLLIFDEVITGYRVGLHGAQGLYNIKPDITCLGKIIGGGFPVGAFGGSKKIMSHLAPLGPVYHAGTLSGNPVAMTAGFATIQQLQADNFYTNLEDLARQLQQGMRDLANNYQIPLSFDLVGGLFGFKFTDEKFFQSFYHQMLHQGVYLAPSIYEAGFISSAHTTQDIQFALQCVEQSFKAICHKQPQAVG